MTAKRATAKNERTAEENGVVHAITHLVGSAAKNADDLRGQLTKVDFRAEVLRSALADAADALNSSTKIFTDGVGAFATEVLSVAKASAREGLDAARTVVNAKSLEDVVHAESEYLQKYITASIDAGRKLIQISAETGQNAMEPITRGLSAAASREAGSRDAA